MDPKVTRIKASYYPVKQAHRMSLIERIKRALGR